MFFLQEMLIARRQWHFINSVYPTKTEITVKHTIMAVRKEGSTILFRKLTRKVGIVEMLINEYHFNKLQYSLHSSHFEPAAIISSKTCKTFREGSTFCRMNT